MNAETVLAILTALVAVLLNTTGYPVAAAVVVLGAFAVWTVYDARRRTRR